MCSFCSIFSCLSFISVAVVPAGMGDGVDTLSSTGLSELAEFIIRPPRAQYSRADLGDTCFVVDGVPARREDLHLENPRGLHLHASHFRAERRNSPRPTVVYLHGNGSCRVEATVLLALTIPYGMDLFAFDFSGSGRSDGRYISLGVWERDDVATVVTYLVEVEQTPSVILWGHSMGAATALMYAGLCAIHPAVKALVLDSPFASFDKLAQNMVADMPLPKGFPRKLALSVGVRAVRKIVRDRAGFDVHDIDPLSALRAVPDHLPALFLHGTADAVVPLSHGQLLFDHYPSKDKLWLPLSGLAHDSPRPYIAMDTAFEFILRSISDETSMLFFDALKSRGNVAMLSARFHDAISLYTKALRALVDAMPPAPPRQSSRLTTKTTSTSATTTTTTASATTKSSSSPSPSPPPKLPTYEDVYGHMDHPTSRTSQPSSSQKALHTATSAATGSSPSPPPPPPPKLSSFEDAYGHLDRPTFRSSQPSSSQPTLRSRSRSRSRRGNSCEPKSWRNSSVPNLVTTVKRWRSRGGMSTPPGTPVPTTTASGAAVALDTVAMSSTPGVAATSAVTDDENDGMLARRRLSRKSRERTRRASTDISTRFQQRYTDVEREALAEDGRSESSARHTRFARQRSWRARSVVDRLFARRSRPSPPDVKDSAVSPADSGGSDRSSSATGQRTSPQKSFESRRQARQARSSSRVRTRYRGLRERYRRMRNEETISTREGAQSDIPANCGDVDNPPNLKATVSCAASTLDTLNKALDQSTVLGGHGGGLRDISEWVVDEKQRTLALALLGNRSLARRKVGDVDGALSDASRCLMLDPSWVRGYVRKAAALREAGRLAEASQIVHAGLKRDPMHAGLVDLLRSIEAAATSAADCNVDGGCARRSSESLSVKDTITPRDAAGLAHVVGTA